MCMYNHTSYSCLCVLYITLCFYHSTFSGNSALFGAVFASRNTVGFQGDVVFNENTGPAIQVQYSYHYTVVLFMAESIVHGIVLL